MHKKATAVRTPQERNKIVVQWMPLVKKIVNDLAWHDGVKMMGLDECCSVGHEALIRSADLWDESRGIKFVTYAYLSIKRRVLMVANKAMYARLVSLEELIFRGSDDRTTGASVVVEPDDDSPPSFQVVERKESKAASAAYAESLLAAIPNSMDRRVIELRFFGGLDLKAISKIIGKSRARVSQRQLRGLAYMRRAAARNGHKVTCEA